MLFHYYETRVLNGSHQPANFARCFTWTRHQLFFGNYPQKSQNLMTVFCSNTLIFVPQCWKWSLDFKRSRFQNFSRGHAPGPPSYFQLSQVAPVVQVFSFSAYSKAFATYLKPYWKPSEAVLEPWNLRIISMNWIYVYVVSKVRRLVFSCYCVPNYLSKTSRNSSLQKY